MCAGLVHYYINKNDFLRKKKVSKNTQLKTAHKCCFFISIKIELETLHVKIN